MAIEFRCTQCDKQLRTPDDKAGMSAKCPQCGAQLTIPSPAAAAAEDNIFDADLPAPSAPPPIGRGAAPGGAARPCPMCGGMAPAGAARCPSCGEALRSSGGGPRPLRAMEVFHRAWAIYQKDMGLCLGANVLVIGIMYAISMVGQLAMMPFMQFNGPPQNPEAMLTTFIPIMLVMTLVQLGAQCWLSTGLRKVMVRVACGEKAEVTDVFRGGRYLLRMLGATLLIGLLCIVIVAVVIAAFVAAMVAAEVREPGPVIIGVVLAYLTAIVATAFLIMPFFWPYLSVLVDRDPPGMGCLGESLALTRGNRGQSILLLFLAMLVQLAGLAMCCVGTILTTPLVELMLAVGYTDMTGQTRTDV